jgi:hypothetical protein
MVVIVIHYATGRRATQYRVRVCLRAGVGAPKLDFRSRFLLNVLIGDGAIPEIEEPT